MRILALAALLGLGLIGCGFKVVKQADLDKMAAAGQAAQGRPATPTPEPLRKVKASRISVELGEKPTGLVEIGEAGKDYPDIPRFPHSRESMLHETAAGGGSSPRQADALSYQTKASLDRVAAFYARVLPAKGWRLVPGSVKHGEILRAATYRKKRERLTLEMSRLLHSMVHAPGTEPSPITVINITLASRPAAR